MINQLEIPETADATERLLITTPSEVFRAVARPEMLTQWWVPKDFASTFEVFEFVPGGTWKFVLHAPTGANYPNEIVFLEIEPDRKIVLDHLGAHRFVLTVTLEPVGAGTRLVWVQDHLTEEAHEQLRDIVRVANEQNLDRLESVLAQ